MVSWPILRDEVGSIRDKTLLKNECQCEKKQEKILSKQCFKPYLKNFVKRKMFMIFTVYVKMCLSIIVSTALPSAIY